MRSMVGVFVDICVLYVGWLLYVDWLVNDLGFNDLDFLVESVTLYNFLNKGWFLCDNDCCFVAMLMRVLNGVFVVMVMIVVDANSLDAFSIARIQCSGSHTHVVVVITAGGFLFPCNSPAVSSWSSTHSTHSTRMIMTC